MKSRKDAVLDTDPGELVESWDDPLFDRLKAILKLRNRVIEGSRAEDVQSLLKVCLVFVRQMMTEEIFHRAMRSGKEGEGLFLFANRIAQLEPILGDNWPSDFSFGELRDDLFYIANGDAPNILKRRKKRGKFVHSHSLLEKKLEAVGWYKVLANFRVPAAERQALITGSYASSWDAFGKWKKEARDKLGTDYVQRFLFDFERINSASAASHDDPASWAKEQCREAGRIYQERLWTAAKE